MIFKNQQCQNILIQQSIRLRGAHRDLISHSEQPVQAPFGLYWFCFVLPKWPSIQVQQLTKAHLRAIRAYCQLYWCVLELCKYAKIWNIEFIKRVTVDSEHLNLLPIIGRYWHTHLQSRMQTLTVPQLVTNIVMDRFLPREGKKCISVIHFNFVLIFSSHEFVLLSISMILQIKLTSKFSLCFCTEKNSQSWESGTCILHH